MKLSMRQRSNRALLYALVVIGTGVAVGVPLWSTAWRLPLGELPVAGSEASEGAGGGRQADERSIEPRAPVLNTGEAIVDSRQGGELLRIHLTEVDDCQLAGMEVHTLPDAGGLEHAPVDQAGEASLAGMAGAGWVVAWSPAAGVWAVRADRLMGDLELPPVGDSVVDGWIVAGADVDMESLRLELFADVSEFDELEAGLEAPLTAAGVEAHARRACIDAEGAFRVEGLRSSWSGLVRVDAQHCIVPAPELGRMVEDGAGRPYSFRLDAPRRGLRLRVERAPYLRGKLVWSDGEEPVVGAHVRLNASSCPPVNVDSDASGAFSALMPPGARTPPEEWWSGAWRSSLDQVWLEIEHPEGARVSIVRALSEVMPEGDLGTLVVPRGERVVLHVMDSSGGNVPDAIAVVERRSARADDQGLVTLPPCILGARISVGARGFAREVVDVDSGLLGSDRPHMVVLSPGTDLVMRVHDQRDRAPAGLTLSVTCDWEFVGRPIDWSAILLHDLLTGCANRGAQLLEDGDGARLELRSAGDGRFVLLGVRGRSTINAIVRDPTGNVLIEQTVVAPSAGDPSVVELRLPFEVGVLEGKVVRADGTALEGAKVCLRGPERANFARTDADGRYRLESVRVPASDLELLVDADGHAPAHLQTPYVQHGQELPLVRMESSRKLKALVIDAAGEPVLGAQVSVETPGGAAAAGAEQGEGYYVIDGAPLGPCNVLVQIGSFRYESLAPAVVSEVVIQVPRLATLQVILPPRLVSRKAEGWFTLDVLTAEGDLAFQGPFKDADGVVSCVVRLEEGRYRVRATLSRPIQKENASGTIERIPVTAEAEVEVATGSSVLVKLE